MKPLLLHILSIVMSLNPVIPPNHIRQHLLDPYAGVTADIDGKIRDSSGEERPLLWKRCVRAEAGQKIIFPEAPTSVILGHWRDGSVWKRDRDVTAWLSGNELVFPETAVFKFLTTNTGFYPCEEGAGGRLYNTKNQQHATISLEGGNHADFRAEDQNAPATWCDLYGWTGYVDHQQALNFIVWHSAWSGAHFDSYNGKPAMYVSASNHLKGRNTTNFFAKDYNAVGFWDDHTVKGHYIEYEYTLHNELDVPISVEVEDTFAVPNQTIVIGQGNHAKVSGQRTIKKSLSFDKQGAWNFTGTRILITLVADENFNWNHQRVWMTDFRIVSTNHPELIPAIPASSENKGRDALGFPLKYPGKASIPAQLKEAPCFMSGTAWIEYPKTPEFQTDWIELGATIFWGEEDRGVNYGTIWGWGSHGNAGPGLRLSVDATNNKISVLANAIERSFDLQILEGVHTISAKYFLNTVEIYVDGEKIGEKIHGSAVQAIQYDPDSEYTAYTVGVRGKMVPQHRYSGRIFNCFANSLDANGEKVQTLVSSPVSEGNGVFIGNKAGRNHGEINLNGTSSAEAWGRQSEFFDKEINGYNIADIKFDGSAVGVRLEGTTLGQHLFWISKITDKSFPGQEITMKVKVRLYGGVRFVALVLSDKSNFSNRYKEAYNTVSHLPQNWDEYEFEITGVSPSKNVFANVQNHAVNNIGSVVEIVEFSISSDSVVPASALNPGQDIFGNPIPAETAGAKLTGRLPAGTEYKPNPEGHIWLSKYGIGKNHICVVGDPDTAGPGARLRPTGESAVYEEEKLQPHEAERANAYFGERKGEKPLTVAKDFNITGPVISQLLESERMAMLNNETFFQAYAYLQNQFVGYSIGGQPASPLGTVITDETWPRVNGKKVFYPYPEGVYFNSHSHFYFVLYGTYAKDGVTREFNGYYDIENGYINVDCDEEAGKINFWARCYDTYHLRNYIWASRIILDSEDSSMPTARYMDQYDSLSSEHKEALNTFAKGLPGAPPDITFLDLRDHATPEILDDSIIGFLQGDLARSEDLTLADLKAGVIPKKRFIKPESPLSIIRRISDVNLSAWGTGANGLVKRLEIGPFVTLS
ncbi:hypothetical protein FUAX_09840 [Fulvitalea axinellae]|uniref:CBM-cenC domain-containing protein n=1 Tax=Fulvitalea axinellae TaxID=1182444 RepID=A0AAU9CNN4_9BACT|nr:hypothetical protein FUAX_09840 [Fulvitalea axinellae]